MHGGTYWDLRRLKVRNTLKKHNVVVSCNAKKFLHRTLLSVTSWVSNTLFNSTSIGATYFCETSAIQYLWILPPLYVITFENQTHHNDGKTVVRLTILKVLLLKLFLFFFAQKYLFRICRKPSWKSQSQFSTQTVLCRELFILNKNVWTRSFYFGNNRFLKWFLTIHHQYYNSKVVVESKYLISFQTTETIRDYYSTFTNYEKNFQFQLPWKRRNWFCGLHT